MIRPHVPSGSCRRGAAIVIAVIAFAAMRFALPDIDWAQSSELQHPQPSSSLCAEQRILLGDKLDINEADVHDFMALARIGPVLARRIVDDRTANGRFASVDDLMRVHGIGRTIVNINRYALIVR